MCRQAAIVTLFLLAALRAFPQARPPDATPEPVILKSTSRAVQLDVFVDDPSGRPVHGLQKNDFVVTDNDHPREIRIFSGEIGANQTAPSSAKTTAPTVYSNRFGMGDAQIVTAIVIDAVPRPEGLQQNAGRFRALPPQIVLNIVRQDAISAVNRMVPGQMIAIYAACPELR